MACHKLINPNNLQHMHFDARFFPAASTQSPLANNRKWAVLLGLCQFAYARPRSETGYDQEAQG